MQSKRLRQSSASGRRRLAAPLIGAALLTGCATGLSDPASVCPPVVKYSPEFMQEAAAALLDLPPGSPLERLIIDYLRERDQLRECQ